MQKGFCYDSENIYEIVESLSMVLNDLKGIDLYARNSGDYLTTAISCKRLIRMEIYADIYYLYFEGFDCSYNPRTVRKYLGKMLSSDAYGFVRVNENEIVNMNYVQYIDQQGIRVKYVDEPIPMSRPGRKRIAAYLQKYKTKL